MVSRAFPILSYLPPYQEKNSEYHRGDYWAWSSQNYFKMLYDVAAFTFSPTLWFVFNPQPLTGDWSWDYRVRDEP